MATLAEVMAELEAMGKPQYRKIYTRHGVHSPQFGVNTADLKTLQKRIKRDHALALALWATGNYDARHLATRIADPQQADEALLESWVRDLDNYGITDALTVLAAQTPFMRTLGERWVEADGEWIETAGWSLIGQMALKDKALPDATFLPWIERIERDIHPSKNRVRYAMNSVLIAIGGRSAALAQRATAAAQRIGVVEVDHGQTNCETPDAAAYIAKMRARASA